jgi:hypothetical protein
MPEIPPGIDPSAVRRSTRLGRIALAVASDALRGSGSLPAPEQTGLVVGTALADLDETAGFLGGIHARGARFASPQFFQRSVHGAVAGELAILFGLRAFNLTVSDGLASGEAALAAGLLAIRAGRVSRCLVVAVDGRSEALSQALAALGRPDDAGEGAAALVVETWASAQQRGAQVLASLAGVDLSQAPPFRPGAARRQRALRRRGLRPGRLRGIARGGAADRVAEIVVEVVPLVGPALDEGLELTGVGVREPLGVLPALSRVAPRRRWAAGERRSAAGWARA